MLIAYLKYYFGKFTLGTLSIERSIHLGLPHIYGKLPR